MAHSYRDERQLVQVLRLNPGVELPSAATSGREAIGSLHRRTIEFIGVVRAVRRRMVPLTVATVALGVVAYVVWVLAVIAQLPSQSHWFGIAGLAGAGVFICRFFVRGVLSAGQAATDDGPSRDGAD
jgi:hypothetical protein